MAIYFGLMVLIVNWITSQCQEISPNVQMQNLPAEVVFEEIPDNEHEDNDMSVVAGDRGTPDYVRLINPPSVVYEGTQLTIEYKCRDPYVVGVQLKVMTFIDTKVIVFHRWWHCGTYSEPLYQQITVHLQDKLAYRPSLLNRNSVSVRSTELLVWIVDDPVLDSLKLDIFPQATARILLPVSLPAPYDRPGKPITVCLSWWMTLQMNKPFTPVCKVEPEVFTLVEFPVALSGKYHGLHRMIPEYENPTLRQQRLNSFHHPKFTISLWLYIVEYCIEGRTLCSIVQRLTYDERYCTPLVYINSEGKIHLQAVAATGETKAYLTSADFTVPKLQWCHLVITINGTVWTVTKKCMDERNEKPFMKRSVTNFPWPVYYDALMSLTIIGGTEVTASFKGYVGEAKIYRNKLYVVSQLPDKDPYDKIFELGLSDWNAKCSRYLKWVQHVEYRAKMLLDEIIKRKTCQDEIYKLFLARPSEALSSCHAYAAPIPRTYMSAYRIVRSWILKGHKYTWLDISNKLMENVTSVLEQQGLLGLSSIMATLRQASCYGNHNATFMLSTILNSGMGVKANENQALKYLMYGALESNVLCQLALGNKHMYGLDGVPQDYEQAYVYYQRVAIQTRNDKERHASDGLYTEHVRLTDERAIKDMTDEEGDIFHWLKLQSRKGVLSAQKELARMLYWGARGVARNTDEAVSYYRMGADAEDPASLYNYGIVLMKGHGVKPNLTAAVELFEKSAARGYPMAYNVLGWYALEHLKDYEKARDYLERAYKKGNADAAHNLGYMHVIGKYPGKPADRVAAKKYYAFAAKRGQLDSGIMIAQYNIRGGHPELVRDVQLAAEWARFIAEQNVAIGQLLRRGLKAYMKRNWPSALVYYHMAAETGLETGTFNTAYLCDENNDGLVHYLEKDCVWRFYNLSTLRELHQVNSYSLIKMGDYYWYGCKGHRDVAKAAHYYALAAKKGDPHALFNLGFMLEEGASIPQKNLRQLGIVYSNHTTDLLIQIYNRCRESKKTEAYIPCSISLYRLYAMYLLNNHHILIQVLSVLFGFVLFVSGGAWTASLFRSRNQLVNTV